MLSKFDCGNFDRNNSDLSNGQLLRDIEEISNGLCVVDRNPGIKSHFRDSKSKSKSKAGFNGEGECCREEHKSSSLWGWKPLKALSHIRHKKFACCFFCHVHCVENLPSDFDAVCMSVHLERKDDVFRTRPLRVSNGVVDFRETLVSKCNVYGAKSGNGSFMKYEPKHFLLYVSVFGAEGLDVGKHWVDLTRLLPLTLEELERDKCSGKWSTSFKLEGKAAGGILQVSFGFLVTKDSLAELGGNSKLSLALNLEHNGLSRMSSVPDCASNKGNTSLRRVGSVPSRLTDVKPKDVDDFSDSIDLLYGKIAEGVINNPSKLDLVYEHLESLKLAPNSLAESIGGVKQDDSEFIVTDEGVELESTSEELDVSTVEVIDVAEIFQGDGISSDEDTKSSGKEVSSSVANDSLIDKHSILDAEEPVELNSLLDSICGEFMTNEFLMDESGLLDIQESEELKPSEDLISGEFEVNHKGSRLLKSLSLDDLSRAVVEDFCNLWQGSTPSTPRSNTNLESPRELLLRQFEEDMLTCGSFFSGLDVLEDESEFDHTAASVSSIDVNSVDISPVITKDTGLSVNQESQRKSQVKNLERLETQSLMKRWGLDEDAFLSSPHYSSGGFGSPIFVPSELEEPIGLPPLGEGLESLLQLKNGGVLRSMSPHIFKNAKNCGCLIVQASRLVVLPAELGSDIMEILHGMRSVGSETLSKKLHSLLPLDELSGKTMEQLAWEASFEAEAYPRSSSAHHESGVEIRVEGPSHNSVGSSSTFSIETREFSPLALDSLEDLTIEGLKLQSGMSDEDAPSSIRVKPVREASSRHRIDNYVRSFDLGVGGINELLDLSISLEEWLEIDSGKLNDENHVSDRTLKLLRAHHAKNLAEKEILQNEAAKCGFLGDNLTVGLMVQLRDPLRNYEPAGSPMLGLTQVERILNPVSMSSEESTSLSENEINGNVVSEEDAQQSAPTFILKEIHIAGLNLESDHIESWASKRQQQSGSRWLLASGLTQKSYSRHSKSRSLVRLSTQVLRKTKPRSLLWSISRTARGDGSGIGTQFSSLDPYTRNPDLIFP